jgi:hypothetical protein
MLCRAESKYGMEKSTVSSRAGVMAMAEIAMLAATANSGGTVLFAFYSAGPHCLESREAESADSCVQMLGLTF